MDNNNEMNLAEKVRNRITNLRERNEQEMKKAAEEAAKEFASKMNSMQVRLERSELEKMWPNMVGRVLKALEEEGFEVASRYDYRRTGFLGLKEEMVWTYTISVPTDKPN